MLDMRSRRVCKFENPCEISVQFSMEGWKYYYLGPGRKELKGEVIGVIGESSNLFCNLLHCCACDSLS